MWSNSNYDENYKCWNLCKVGNSVIELAPTGITPVVGAIVCYGLKFWVREIWDLLMNNVQKFEKVTFYNTHTVMSISKRLVPTAPVDDFHQGIITKKSEIIDGYRLQS